MSSGSNVQLQQQLEYTLLNPDCYSWWISKMQSDTLEERYAIKLCFRLGKNATKTYGMLQAAFGAHCMNRAWVFEWHKRSKKGRVSVRDYERCGRSKEVNTPELIDYLTKMGIKTAAHPPYSLYLGPCDFWLFPKLRGCRYETIEEMKEAVTKVIDLPTQEDFHGAFQKLLERCNKCIAAGGVYFEGD